MGEPFEIDDEIPWRRHFSREDSGPRGSWIGTGALRLTLDECFEAYGFDGEEIAASLRAALRIITDRGWNGGVRYSSRAFDAESGPVSPGFAITLAFRAAISPAFNAHVCAKAALEHFIKQDLDEWNRDRERTSKDVSELFLRAIHRVTHRHHRRAS